MPMIDDTVIRFVQQRYLKSGWAAHFAVKTKKHQAGRTAPHRAPPWAFLTEQVS
jgi:hypothetical protein